MSKLIIRTDNKWKPFKFRVEVPARILANEFDWARPAENYSDGFICYKRYWTHQANFTHLTTNDPELNKWQGVENWSWSNGLLIRMSNDGEKYQIAYFYLTSEH